MRQINQAGGDGPLGRLYDTRSAMLHAADGKTEDWVHRYLNAGDWANPAISEGLKQAPRWWRGPLPLPLEALSPALGPAAYFEYPVSPENWEARTGKLAAGIEDPLDLPPLILEFRSGELSIRDGNHRFGAMKKLGWKYCWALIWYNSEADFGTHPISLEFNLRPCREDDLDDLEWFGLMTEYRQTILEAFRRKQVGEVEMLVAEAGGFPTGQVWVDLAKKAAQSTGILWALRVLPPLQRLGIGDQLIRAGEELLKAIGIEASEICVEKDNPDAKRLYERLGYQVVDEIVEKWDYLPPGGEWVYVVSEEWVLRRKLK